MIHLQEILNRDQLSILKTTANLTGQKLKSEYPETVQEAREIIVSYYNYVREMLKTPLLLTERQITSFKNVVEGLKAIESIIDQKVKESNANINKTACEINKLIG